MIIIISGNNCKTKPAAWIGPQKVGKTMANKDYHEIMTEITSQLTAGIPLFADRDVSSGSEPI